VLQCAIAKTARRSGPKRAGKKTNALNRMPVLKTKVKELTNRGKRNTCPDVGRELFMRGTKCQV
jgi:hypothetical protein